jgi:hypothetical protein
MKSVAASVGDLPGATPPGCNQACLPSSNSVYAVVSGETRAIPVLVLHYAARSAIVGLGLAAAGLRGKELVVSSALAGAAFELSLLGWVLWHRKNRS